MSQVRIPGSVYQRESGRWTADLPAVAIDVYEGSKPFRSPGRAFWFLSPIIGARQPRRHSNPELAQAIKEGKLETGKSWRWIVKVTSLSHGYLVQLSNGQRVPSRDTVEVLAKALDIEDWAVDRLRSTAGLTGGSSP